MSRTELVRSLHEYFENPIDFEFRKIIKIKVKPMIIGNNFKILF